MRNRLLFVLGLTLVAGCRTGDPAVAPGHTYAVWVTRYQFRTAGDVVRIMQNCKEAGFDTVLFQVRGNGTAFYRSKIEPWAEELGGTDPGFDPLQVAVREAHARGLQLHAWVNVMPAWQGPSEPRDPEQLYHRRPEWFWYDAGGQRQPMIHRVGDRTRAWYVSLNPCLPEVRDYLVRVFREIVENYEVDGLHLDYIRFPREPVVPGEKIPDYPRDARTLALFRAQTGHTPEQDPGAWNRWRTEQVTALVAGIRAMMRETRPGAKLSAAVGTDRSRSLRYHRNGWHWAEQGLIDIAFPMNYKPSVATFEEGLKMWLPPPGAVRLVPGLWFDRKLTTGQGAEVTAAQVRLSVDRTGSFCLFGYHSLFDRPRDDRPKATSRTRRPGPRAQRREILLPVLQDLSRHR